MPFNLIPKSSLIGSILDKLNSVNLDRKNAENNFYWAKYLLGQPQKYQSKERAMHQSYQNLREMAQ
jgi:hypothetical protein